MTSDLYTVQKNRSQPGIKKKTKKKQQGMSNHCTIASNNNTIYLYSSSIVQNIWRVFCEMRYACI